MPDRKYLILLGVLLVLLFLRLVVFSPEKPFEQDVPTSFAFQCMDCQHEWASPIADVEPWYPGGMANDTHPVPCAACKKRSALLKRKCLWCREGYVPSVEVWRHNQDLGAPSGSAHRERRKPMPEICPHCKKDVLGWQPK